MDNIDDLEDGMKLTYTVFSWLEETVQLFDCDSVDDLSPSKIKKQNKDVLVGPLNQALVYLKLQNEIISKLWRSSEELKCSVVNSQTSVIALQKQVIECTNDQLQMKRRDDDQLEILQETVKSSVQETVKSEFKSYSHAVQNSSPTAINPQTLKQVVKCVVDEEDRSRNVMVFGLKEEANEQLCEKISELFQEVGEKPRLEATRIGAAKTSDYIRPVKVTLASSISVTQILTKARTLKQSEKHKTVYICPDRTLQQRAHHQQLVQSLKQKYIEEPGKKHYIRAGKVCSVDLTVK